MNKTTNKTVKQHRLTDETNLDEKFIADALARNEEVIIQYSNPIYSRDVLSQLDSLCVQHGEQLEIRFFGHYREPFDFAALQYLPHVQNLSVDCGKEIKNLDTLFTLAILRRLRFGTFSKVPSDFLSHLALHKLKSLSLAAKKPYIDLSPLSKFRNLTQLHITSQYRHIEVIAELPALERLSLSGIKNTVKLGFINNIRSLRRLFMILGGREDINEVSHSSIERLDIIRVRGLSSFDPSQFPSLRYLQIEDQIRLTQIVFTASNNQLEELRLLNCKGLARIDGLGALPSLQGLRIYGTSASLDDLLTAGLPIQLKVFAFYTSKERLDKPIRQRLDALGYLER